MMISISVPATSANLGPGFDCLGLALDLWNQFDLHEIGPGESFVVETIGEGVNQFPSDQSHMVARIMLDELVRLTGDASWRHTPPGLRLTCRNRVPAGSGLGSSSTVVLGGLLLAHAYTRHLDGRCGGIDRDAVLQRAIDLEGHGDNVAPALLGGLVAVSTSDGPPLVRRIAIPPTRVVVCVPNYHFLTSTARSVLPTHVIKGDAISNIGRAILVVEALRTADYDLLGRAMHDCLHEPYRLPAIPGAVEARAAALAQGAAAVTLSGAGPGLIAFSSNRHQQIGAAMVEAFEQAQLSARYWTLDSLEHGARYTV
jgi:homoserine kinase